MSGLLTVFVLQDRRWQAAGLRWRWLANGLRGGLPFYLTDMGAVGSLYFDRFLVSLFLGLEPTGVYIFFWSAANAMHTLVVYGVMQPQVSKLIRSANKGDAVAFNRLRRDLLIESWGWAGLLSAGLCVLIYVAVPLFGRPLLEQSLAIFWLIMVATMLRIAADGLNFGLYAIRRDRAMAAVSLSGVTASAALNAALIPLAGLAGAGLAYIATAAGLLACRHVLIRDAKFGGNDA